MRRAAGQLPDQPAVDGAEGQPPLGRRLPGALGLVQTPFQLGAREIRIGQKAGAPGQLGLKPLGAQLSQNAQA
jgi:hypothetical protein